MYRHGVARAYSYSRILGEYCTITFSSDICDVCSFITIILYHCNLNLLSSMRENHSSVSCIDTNSVYASNVNNKSYMYILRYKKAVQENYTCVIISEI